MNTEYLDRANQQFHNKNYQAALENYNLAISHSPSMPEAYYCRGLVKRIMGDHKGAIQDFSITAILNPKMILAFYYRGISYYEMGDYAYAIANFNHAIFLEPNFANVYYHRAVIHGELGHTEQSIKDFKKTASLAKKQSNMDLFQRAKKAQALAKKFSNTNHFNRSLVFTLKFALLSILLGTSIVTLKYLNNDENLELPTDPSISEVKEAEQENP